MKNEDYTKLSDNNEMQHSNSGVSNYSKYQQVSRNQKRKKKSQGEKKRWDQLYELVGPPANPESTPKRDQGVHEEGPRRRRPRGP